jgi:hypothetical protein
VSAGFGGGKRGFLAVCTFNGTLALGCAWFVYQYARDNSRNEQEKQMEQAAMTKAAAATARLRAESESSGSFRNLFHDWKFLSCASLSLAGAYAKEVFLVRCASMIELLCCQSILTPPFSVVQRAARSINRIRLV